MEVLKQIISLNFKKSSSQPKIDGGATILSTNNSENIPGSSFLSKFLGEFGSAEDAENFHLNDQIKSTSLSEYTQQFPASIGDYIVSKSNDGYAIHPKILSFADVQSIGELRRVRGFDSGILGNNLCSILWLEVAKIYVQEGLFTNADAAVNQALKGNELFAPVYGVFGLIEESRGGFTEAITFYRRGISIDPHETSCLIGLARCLLASASSATRENLFEAERHLLAASHNGGKLIPSICALLASLYAQSDRPQEAKDAFLKSMEIEAKTPLRPYSTVPIVFF